MEERQFQKMEQWFGQLNSKLNELQSEMHDTRSAMATRQMVENRFDMLALSMQNLLERFQKLG